MNKKYEIIIEKKKKYTNDNIETSAYHNCT